MTGQELREQLARIADDAPVAAVPADTYRRGRRSVTRTRIVGAVVAVGCVVLAAVVGGQLLHGPSGPGYSGSSADQPGIPDHIYDYGLVDTPVKPQKIADLSQHPAVVAYPIGGESAAALVYPDGSYVQVRLPGFESAGNTVDGFALSPDGTALAWYDREAKRAADTGVSVLSLTSGRIDHYRAAALGVPQGVLVTQLGWSPNSRFLVWGGQPITGWSKTRGVSFSNRTVGSVIDRSKQPQDTNRRDPSRKIPWNYVEVCNDGTLVQEIYGGPRAWRAGRTLSRADAKAIDLASCGVPGAPMTIPAQTSNDLGRLTTGETVSVRVTPSWDHGTIYLGKREIAWVSGYIPNLSVATGLINAEHPSHPTDRPSWAPGPSHRNWWIAGGIGVGILVLLGLAIQVRRWKR